MTIALQGYQTSRFHSRNHNQIERAVLTKRIRSVGYRLDSEFPDIDGTIRKGVTDAGICPPPGRFESITPSASYFFEPVLAVVDVC